MKKSKEIKMKIMIVCSKYFYENIPKIRKRLEKEGHKLKMPNSYDEPFAEERFKKMGKEEHIKWKADMMKRHEENIKSQDAILVLNFEKKGIPNYIGGNTLMEIGFAHANHKKVFLLNPLPENVSYLDEIKAMYDEILHGDISKIPLESPNNKDFSLNKIGQEAEKIEEEIGLNFDDVLNKLTQELGEFNDAVQEFRGRYCRQQSENNGHIKEELGDLIFNIASICRKIGINPDDFNKYASNTLDKFQERKELYKQNLK
ncbi:MAG: MazG nucleotide pyrophosphohydrolase domain-containing protein [Candidatus Nanoarchaeia archaeon]